MGNTEIFTIYDGILGKYTGPGGEITVPEGVTAIGDRAFRERDDVTRVHLPNGLKTIGTEAFSRCSNLESIHIPEGVTYIGARAFYSSGLKKLTLPSSVSHLGTRFATFSRLAELEVPQAVKKVHYAFQDFGGVIIAPHIPLYDFTSDVRLLAAAGFAEGYCDRREIDPDIRAEYLTYIKNKRKALYPYAMEREHLMILLIQEKMIPQSQFQPLLDQSIAEKRAALTAMLLEYQEKNLKRPDPLKEIDREFKAMERVAKDQEIFQTTGVLKVGEAKKSWIFRKLENGGISIRGYKGTDAEAVIPSAIGKDAVTEIFAEAFKHAKVKSVRFPEGIQTIGHTAFWNCQNLKQLALPKGLQRIEGSSLYHGAFEECCKLTSVTFPEGMTTLGEKAFFKCDHLTSVTIPASLTKIAPSAFSDCPKLTQWIVHPDNPVFRSQGPLLLKENGVFACRGLSGELVIPEDVNEIQDGAFDGCAGLETVTLPENVTKIGPYAFARCENLISITLPESLTSIGNYAFTDCTKLTGIRIPAGVTEICYRTFYSCSKLAQIDLPDSIRSIADGAFAFCSSLTEITIPEDVEEISSTVFTCCSKLKQVVLPESLTSIQSRAFDSCKMLRRLTIPAGVTQIDDRAFDGCPNLTLHAPAGSYAEEYAKRHDIQFQAL